MAIIRPFKGLRPRKELAAKIAAPPYDVLSSAEAREMAKGNPYSFLHVSKPEIDLPADTDVYHEAVYLKGQENLNRLITDGILFQDKTPCLYIYRQIMGEHSQVGVVAAASVDEYQSNRIKKHELTRADKEDDRVKHVNYLNSQTGPVFLTYKSVEKIDAAIAEIVTRLPEYDFTAEDGIRHTVWIVSDEQEIYLLTAEFARIDYLYVADGHHRSAAASRVREVRKAANLHHSGKEEYNYFLSVIFPHNQMYIMDYNRVVKDLSGLSAEQFLARVSKKFNIQKLGKSADKPAKKHTLIIYLSGEWYQLDAKSGSFDESDPTAQLDVSILMNNLLAPILGVGDPRKDKRIDFVGGIRGLRELQRRVDSGEMKLAFALFPTGIEDLMAIADAGKVMPPKSTWFEPKLRDGLVSHMLD